MRDLRRLDKGFVTLEGQRIFVPWFGTPRIVPSAADEVAVVKARYWAHLVMAIVFFPALMLGLSLGDPIGFSGVAAAISLVFGAGSVFEGRRARAWPRFGSGVFANTRCMLGYFRSLPFMHRVNTFGWNAFAVLLGWPVLLIAIASTNASLGTAMFAVNLSVLVIGPLLLTLFFLRNAILAMFSLLPMASLRSLASRSGP